MPGGCPGTDSHVSVTLWLLRTMEVMCLVGMRCCASPYLGGAAAHALPRGQMIGSGRGVVGVQRGRQRIQQVGAEDLRALEVRGPERVDWEKLKR